jgi:hypothetical protein
MIISSRERAVGLVRIKAITNFNLPQRNDLPSCSPFFFDHFSDTKVLALSMRQVPRHLLIETRCVYDGRSYSTCEQYQTMSLLLDFFVQGNRSPWTNHNVYVATCDYFFSSLPARNVRLRYECTTPLAVFFQTRS